MKQADGSLLTVTECNARGGIPDGYDWKPDHTAPIAADGQRPGRFVKVTDEHVEAVRRLEKMRRMAAEAPRGPRLVPEPRVRAVRQVVPRQIAPRRTSGSSGRPAARRTSSSSSTAGTDPGDADGGDQEPPPSRLTVAASRGTYTHAASRCPACGSVLLWTSGGLVCANRRCPGWAA